MSDTVYIFEKNVISKAGTGTCYRHRDNAGRGVKWRLDVRCDGLRAKTHAQSTPRLDQYKRRSKLKHNEKVCAGLYRIADVFQTSEFAHFGVDLVE